MPASETGRGALPGSLLDRLGPARRIGVLRFGHMGDLIATTPALRALRQAAPTARITLMTGVGPRQLALDGRLPGVDEVLTVPALPPDPAAVELQAAVRRQRLDVIFQLTGGGEVTNPFVRGMGARCTVGQHGPGAPALDISMPYGALQPDAARMLDVVALAGARPCGTDLAVWMKPGDASAAVAVPGVNAALEYEVVVGVHVGSKSPRRRWPPERYAAVLNGLVEQGGCAILIGNREEASLGEIVRAHARRPDRIVDTCGHLSLAALFGLVAQLDLFIGNDSGPSYLAAALGIPTVTIYGASHPAIYAPLSRVRERALIDARAPCRSGDCDCTDDAPRCLLAISAETVLDETRRLLAYVRAEQP